MKILHVVGDSKFGGGSVIILQLAQAAQMAGWQVEVLTTDDTFQQELAAVGVPFISLDVIWREIRPVRDLLGLYRLYRFLRRSNYGVVHTHTSKAGLIGRLAARFGGIPIIMHTVHGFAFHERSRRVVIQAYALLERIGALAGDRLVTVSEFHRKWAIELGIGRERDVVAIPNGISLERVAVTLPAKEIRCQLGADPGDLMILSVGRLAPEKGLEHLIAAVPMLSKRLQCPFKVLLVGDGPMRSQLEKQIAELGVGDRVKLPGFRADVGNVLSAADIVVMPSLREGLSISLLEAMAAGRAIIASSIGSNREVLENCDAGLLIPPEDIADLAAGVLRLALDPQLRAHLGSNARRIFEAKYTEQRMRDQYLELYEELVRTGRKRCAK